MKLKDCKCIDPHDAGVLLMAIDHMRQDREDRIKDIKKKQAKPLQQLYMSSTVSYEKEIRELENTRERLTDRVVNKYRRK